MRRGGGVLYLEIVFLCLLAMDSGKSSVAVYDTEVGLALGSFG